MGAQRRGMGVTTMSRWAVAVVLACMILGGCVAAAGTPSTVPSPGSSPEGPVLSTASPAGEGDASLDGLSIHNGSTLEVSLVVNGTEIRNMDPGGCLGCGVHGAGIPLAELPPLPWHVVLLTSSSRTLGTLDVHEGDVSVTDDAGGAVTIDAPMLRVSLSCGIIDVWVGPPPISEPAGTAPGPWPSGDCEP